MAKSAPARPAHYTQLCDLLRAAALVGSVGSLLSWDQETYMPHAAAAFRSDQQSYMSALAHEKRTDPRIGQLLARCEQDASLRADAVIAANLREIRRDYDLATKLPTELVAELAKVGSQSQEAWKHARQNSDFKAFRPWLEKMIDLTRRKAECYGVPSGGELYDALLNEYEPGISAREIDDIFRPLRTRLSALVKDLNTKGKRPDTRILGAKIPAERQHALGNVILAALGFDLQAGRLDTTAHPFCSGFAPGDTRLTTRYRDEKFTDALYGTLHEMGHGLYEQGLPKHDHFGLPAADAISLGVHESQSRMWENFVGRSREFWIWALPIVKKHAKPALASATVEQMYRAANTATPSLIRVEADEATYNLHVMLRFAIERDLISGAMKVKDVPERWNASVKDFLGIDVPDDRRGCLQDVHWSFGLIGYFPTYTLGNLYAAQYWEKINADIPTLSAQMRKGQFGDLLAWLRKNIHRHGRRYRAAELCKTITGKPLSADPLLRHLEGRLRPIYGVPAGAAPGGKALQGRVSPKPKSRPRRAAASAAAR